MSGKPLRILGLHGVRNYQGGLEPPEAADRLSVWWRNAICNGLNLPNGQIDVISVRVAYYAHRLHLRTAQGDEDPGMLDPEVQEQIVEWAKLCGAPEETVQGWIMAPARAAVEWVTDRFELDNRSARILIAFFFREVHTFFSDARRRAAALSDVAHTIEQTMPHVIIAHSLGSVLGYEALWTYKHPPIDLLVTLGSPLAMPGIVYDRLTSHDGARSRPPGVTRWINIADPGDIVAVPVGGITARFENVTADLTDAIGAFSFHQVTKYLRCGATAGILANQLKYS